MPPIVTILLSGYLVASVITFALFWKDKRAAQAGRWRTRERTLLTGSFLGGWPGALAARKLLRHKTRDQPFVLYFYLLIALHVLIVGGALWLWFR